MQEERSAAAPQFWPSSGLSRYRCTDLCREENQVENVEYYCDTTIAAGSTGSDSSLPGDYITYDRSQRFYSDIRIIREKLVRFLGSALAVLHDRGDPNVFRFSNSRRRYDINPV